MQVVNSLITGASPLSIGLSFRTFSDDGLLLVLYGNNMAQVCHMISHMRSHDMSCDLLAEIGSCAGGWKTATTVLTGFDRHGNCRYSGCG